MKRPTPKKPPRPRNLAARALSSPLFHLKVAPAPGLYSRKKLKKPAVLPDPDEGSSGGSGPAGGL
jgi:hypothetical protein